uniref:uncharacterized protein n=1 Tax=Myxine glutinosa TaxID=7769 RepID=UPI00358E7E82
MEAELLARSLEERWHEAHANMERVQSRVTSASLDERPQGELPLVQLRRLEKLRARQSRLTLQSRTLGTQVRRAEAAMRDSLQRSLDVAVRLRGTCGAGLLPCELTDRQKAALGTLDVHVPGELFEERLPGKHQAMDFTERDIFLSPGSPEKPVSAVAFERLPTFLSCAVSLDDVNHLHRWLVQLSERSAPSRHGLRQAGVSVARLRASTELNVDNGLKVLQALGLLELDLGFVHVV